MTEVYKPVVGFEGLYEVSNLGNVRSLKGGRRRGVVLKSANSQGYRRLSLSKNGISKGYTVHRLVAKAFLENKDGKPHINHIDGNRANNIVTNLEWCTPQENVRHAFDVLGVQAWNKGKRETVCKQGHFLTTDNTLVRTNNKRSWQECVICQRKARKAFMARRREALQQPGEGEV